MGNQIRKSGFEVSVSDFETGMRLATMLSNSQLAPQAYRNKPEETMVAMMMGNELGLNPMQSIQNLAVINGKPSIYGDAMLALVQNHPSFGGIEESFDESTMTATCTVWRKNGGKHTQRFSKRDADAARLWGKKGPWTDYPKRMLAMRARGFALRNQFADALLGLISVEEARDMPEEKEVNASPSHSNQSNVVNLPSYISEQQASELESMASAHPTLIGKIKKAYELNSLTELDQDKFNECKKRINDYVEAQKNG